MNRLFALAAASAALLLAGCRTEETEELPGTTAPEVIFGIEEETIALEKFDTLSFVAEVTTDGPVDCQWLLDGEVVATTPSMTYKFDKAGTFVLQFFASNDKGEVTKEYTVCVDGIDIVAQWTVAEGSVKSLLGEQFSVSASVSEGGAGLSQKWTLDGAAAGTGDAFSKAFSEIGVHTLTYEATNEDGKTVAATWTITVEDLPLEIQFNNAPGSLDVTGEEETVFSAEVLHGSTGLTQEWVLDGKKVSSESSVTLIFTDRESHTLVYNAANGASESVSKTWNLTVLDVAPFVIADFEGLDSVPSWIKGNSWALSLSDNPKVSSANGSAKVLSDNMSTSTYSTSGYVQIQNMDTVVPDTKREKYNCLSIKFYLGENLYYPFLLFNKSSSYKKLPSRVNGGTFTTEAEFRALIKTDDWNVFEWDASVFGKTTYKDLTGVQTNIFCTWAGSSIGGFDATTNNRHVYLDDIIFTNH